MIYVCVLTVTAQTNKTEIIDSQLVLRDICFFGNFTDFYIRITQDKNVN